MAVALAAAMLASAPGVARAGGLTLLAPQPSWSLSLRSTGYAFQTADRLDATTDQLRFYQQFAGSASGLAGGRITLRGSGRYASSPAAWPTGFANGKLYTGYVEARLAPRLRARAGRQFLQSGVAGLTLDGASLAYALPRGGEASVWGGARAPLGSTFALGRFADDIAAGGRIAFAPAAAHRFALSGAYRERGGVVSERPVGFEYTTTAVRHLRALARAAYDLEGDRWARLEAQAAWQQAPQRPAVTLQLVDRRPSIDAASWFARFTDVRRIRLARGAVRWERRSRFGGELEYVGSFVDTRASSRVGLALLLPHGRLGYSVRTGDAGEENSFYGEAAWQACRWLRLEGEASYLTYALIADAPASDERDLTTLVARACARLRPGLDVTAEVQRLDNPLYSSDVRCLLGVDLALARGTSRYGLDRGGWLR
ncbi:MAG: hypothetical protein ACYDIE_13530 [Candidatus Krumholzibacteriia bacterium]